MVENLNVDKTVLIEFNEIENLKEITETNEVYDIVIVTDLFELSDDIYNFLIEINKILSNEGKILITSINPKWNMLISFFEVFKLKQFTGKETILIQKK